MIMIKSLAKKGYFLGLLVVVYLIYQAISSEKARMVGQNVSGGFGIILNKSVLTPAPSPTPTITPSPMPTPTPTIDWSKFGPCKNIPILMYHHVNEKKGEEATSAGLTISTSQFESQMTELAQKGYSVVSLGQAVDAVELGAALPPKPIVITFDDGYRDFYTDVFPILRAHGYQATLFVPTGLVGSSQGYVTWSEVREMKGSGLVTIGNHTWSHLSLTGKDRSLLEYEISTSQKQFEDFGGGRPQFFAYPYGAYNAQVEQVLRENGIRAAVITSPRPQCARLLLELGRKRIGPGSLGNYGI